MSVPTSRFRFPGFVSGLASAALVLLIQDSPLSPPDDGTVTASRSLLHRPEHLLRSVATAARR